MKPLKNWDNKTWLSSAAYINSFNIFLLKKKKLNKNSQILDIGCGRGKIFGSLSRKFKLINKPIGIDPVIHKDIDRSIDFKSQDVFKFFKTNQNKFGFSYTRVCFRPCVIRDTPSINLDQGKRPPQTLNPCSLCLRRSDLRQCKHFHLGAFWPLTPLHYSRMLLQKH